MSSLAAVPQMGDNYEEYVLKRMANINDTCVNNRIMNHDLFKQMQSDIKYIKSIISTNRFVEFIDKEFLHFATIDANTSEYNSCVKEWVYAGRNKLAGILRHVTFETDHLKILSTPFHFKSICRGIELTKQCIVSFGRINKCMTFSVEILGDEPWFFPIEIEKPVIETKNKKKYRPRPAAPVSTTRVRDEVFEEKPTKALEPTTRSSRSHSPSPKATGPSHRAPKARVKKEYVKEEMRARATVDQPTAADAPQIGARLYDRFKPLFTAEHASLRSVYRDFDWVLIKKICERGRVVSVTTVGPERNRAKIVLGQSGVVIDFREKCVVTVLN